MRGWVTVTPTTDEPERRFAVGATVVVDDDTARTVRDARLTPRLAVWLTGCDTREQAEALRGRWLFVDADDSAPDDPDEYYDHHLEGLGVMVGDRRIGVISDVLHLPGQDVLAVALDAGGQVLVPFVAEIVPEVDVVAGHVVVTPITGLLDAD